MLSTKQYKKLENHIDEVLENKFDKLEEDLKNYLKGYFETNAEIQNKIIKTQESIEKSQNLDREDFHKWNTEVFPVLLKRTVSIWNYFKRNKEVLLDGVEEQVKDLIPKTIEPAIKDSLDNYVETNGRSKMKKSFWHTLFKGGDTKNGKNA